MPSAEYNTTPREIRNFATLQLGLTGAFLVVLFLICGGTDADYPPPWLAALLVVPIILSVVLAERVWLSASPLSPDLGARQLKSEALDAYASQTVRKLIYVEAGMLPAVITGFAGSYGGWPIVIAGFPGILLIAWETWPSMRNVSRTAVMLESEGADTGIVESFRTL